MSKVGRDSPCPCGSGRKYKECCLEEDKEAQRQGPRARIDPPDTIRHVCTALIERCREAAEPGDTGTLIFADFPEYRWAT